MPRIRVHLVNGDYLDLRESAGFVDALLNWYKQGFTRRGRLRHGMLMLTFASPERSRLITLSRAQVTSIEVDVFKAEVRDEANRTLLQTANLD